LWVPNKRKCKTGLPERKSTDYAHCHKLVQVRVEMGQGHMKKVVKWDWRKKTDVWRVLVKGRRQCDLPSLTLTPTETPRHFPIFHSSAEKKKSGGNRSHTFGARTGLAKSNKSKHGPKSGNPKLQNVTGRGTSWKSTPNGDQKQGGILCIAKKEKKALARVGAEGSGFDRENRSTKPNVE